MTPRPSDTAVAPRASCVTENGFAYAADGCKLAYKLSGCHNARDKVSPRILKRHRIQTRNPCVFQPCSHVQPDIITLVGFGPWLAVAVAATEELD
eukprot:2911061-Rhodomonas_salina.3